MPSPYMESETTTQRLDSAFLEIKGLSEFLPPGSARYIEKESVAYVSPGAIHGYSLKFLRTNARVLGELGEIPKDVADEIEGKITLENVPFKRAEHWENIIHHDVRGIVKACWDVLSPRARNYLYLGFTSYDVLNTAQSMALLDFGTEVMVPELSGFCTELVTRAEEHPDTIMMGRTHRQHAAPTTVGHYFLEIVGGVLPALENYNRAVYDLRGKATGFVGTNAARKVLFRTDPREIDRRLFGIIGVTPERITGQTVNQYYYADYMGQLFMTVAGQAKFCNDMRGYQQTEVGEMMEKRVGEQVGSSTGAHKINPINSENVAGAKFRQMMGQMVAVNQDFMTDFQRDLRDSGNKRYYIFEMPNIALGAARKATKIARNLTLRPNKMLENVGMMRGLTAAEPLQLYLQKWMGDNQDAFEGEFRDAHEEVRLLSDRARETGRPLPELAMEDPLMREALDSADPWTREQILDPEKYTGTASEDVREMAGEYRHRLDLLKDRV